MVCGRAAPLPPITTPHVPGTCVAGEQSTVGQGDDLAPQLTLCPVFGGHVEEELIL